MGGVVICFADSHIGIEREHVDACCDHHPVTSCSHEDPQDCFHDEGSKPDSCGCCIDIPIWFNSVSFDAVLTESNWRDYIEASQFSPPLSLPSYDRFNAFIPAYRYASLPPTSTYLALRVLVLLM